MKKFFALLLIAVLLAFTAFAAFEKVNTYNGNFSDVKDTAWYAENVKTAYELGFMNGKGEGTFAPDGNVTVAEGITMAARLHAIYNSKDITAAKKEMPEFRIGFESMDKLADTNTAGIGEQTKIAFKRAGGKIENGILVVQPDKPNAAGTYDPQITIDGFEFSATDYNKATFRMKMERLPNTKPDAKRVETIQFYFRTNINPSIDDKKAVYVKMADVTDNPEEWFDVEIELGEHAMWKDFITGIRFDPTDDNGIFSIDYISFSKSEKKSNTKWYDIYVDYALENGIISKTQFTAEEYSRNITRAEICALFASALPEEYFNPINEIKGIPDYSRDAENADVFLMLYNAGIILGSDSEGSFKAKSDIKRSEIAAIINRVALPENRVKGEISADWSVYGNEYDLEFSDESYLEKVKCEAESVEIKDGSLVLTAKDRGIGARPRFDPKILVDDININAREYAKLKVRMKAEFIGEIEYTSFDFYFMTNKDTELSEAKSLHQNLSNCYVDAAGWYVIDVDFSLHGEWKDNITAFRFDPANTNGIYTIDYIRLTRANPLYNATHEELTEKGYTATRLLQDEGFERGFHLVQVEQKEGYTHGKWQDYCETEGAPLWAIHPIWSKYDLVDDRDTTTDKYTIADKYGANTVTYNPEEKSITMRQNATKIYNGEPHIDGEYKWWPHLLLEQNQSYCPIDKDKNSAAADRIFVEMDIRMTDFKQTTNTDGSNSPCFLVYFYLNTDKAPGSLIWFGLNIFTGDHGISTVTPGWSPDSAAHQYMYQIKPAVVFGGMKNSFNPEKGVVAFGEEWKHIRLDVTEHLDTVVEWANRDKAFPVEITKEDLYIGGVNIGFETHGNYDYEFEFKNFNMISYNK